MFFERLVDFINAVSSVAVEVICFLTNIFEVLWFVSCVAMPFGPLQIWVYGFESCYEDIYVRKQAMKASHEGNPRCIPDASTGREDERARTGGRRTLDGARGVRYLDAIPQRGHHVEASHLVSGR